MKSTFALLLSVLTAAFSVSAQIQPIKPFKTGDRVAFVGNSITEAGYYESYIWLYYMLHFPNRKITIFNKGIGGDRAVDIYKRFDDDVAPADPTVICLTFGMNDSGYYEFLRANADSTAQVRLKDIYHYFELIEAQLKKLPNTEKILIASSPYDETVKIKGNLFPGKTKVMEQIAAFQEQAAKDNHWGWVDFLRPMTAINLEQQKTDSAFTLTGGDRIHPGNAGHFVMAYTFLKAQGLDDKPVADFSINASSLQTDRATNCHITNVIALPGKSGVKFNYLANSLPFPVDTVARMYGNPRPMSQAVPLTPFYSSFNREMLRVSSLADGNYDLTIDGRKIGNWSAAQLGEGINLAQISNTPEYEQAMTILQLNEERMGLEAKLRSYYWLQFDYLRDIGLKFNDTQVASDSVQAAAAKRWDVASKRDTYRFARFPAVRAAWQKETDLLVNDIYTLNQPKTHLVEIKKD